MACKNQKFRKGMTAILLLSVIFLIMGCSQKTSGSSGTDNPVAKKEPQKRLTVSMKFKEVLNENEPPNSQKRYGPTLMTEEAVKSARVGKNEIGIPKIDITFTTRGNKRFRQITAKLARQKRQLAIIVNDKEVAAPIVQVRIDSGHAEISGTFTAKEAKSIANGLNANK